MKTMKNLIIAALVSLLVSVSFTVFAGRITDINDPIVTVQKETTSKVTLNLTNLQGQPTMVTIAQADGTEVYSETISGKVEYAKILDLSGLANGTYLLSVDFQDRVIKQLVKVEKAGVIVEDANLITILKPFFRKGASHLDIILKDAQDNITVTILDNNLNSIYRATEISNDSFAKRYDLKQLPTGTYFAKVNFGGEEFTQAIELK